VEAAITTKRIPLVLSWLVLFFGLLVYLGWAVHSPALTSILPDQATMKANTALCFILLGAALVLHQQPSLRKQRAARLLASLVCLLALLTLVQFLFKINLGIDEFPFVDDMGSVATDALGRMSAPTAISLSLISLTVIMEKAWSEKTRRYILVLVQIISLSVFLSFPFSLAFGDSIFFVFWHGTQHLAADGVRHAGAFTTDGRSRLDGSFNRAHAARRRHAPPAGYRTVGAIYAGLADLLW
jgi:hypothetical protein